MPGDDHYEVSAAGPAESPSHYAQYVAGHADDVPASHYAEYPGAAPSVPDSHYAAYLGGGPIAESHYAPEPSHYDQASHYEAGPAPSIYGHYEASHYAAEPSEPSHYQHGPVDHHYNDGVGAAPAAPVVPAEPAAMIAASSDFLKSAPAAPLAQRGQLPGAARQTKYDNEFNQYFQGGAAKTRRFDAGELASHTRGVDGSGGAGVTASLTNQDGSKLDTSDGRSIWGGRAAGNHNWAMMPDGTVRTMSEAAEVRGAGATLEKAHHSTLADGGDVVAAGEMAVANGRLGSINNNTGHYRATAGQLYSAVDKLDKQGVVPHAVGPKQTTVSAEGEKSVSALAALVGQSPKQAAALQGELDAAGNSGPKSSLGVAGHDALITDAQADKAMHLQSVLGRRRELDSLRGADHSAAKASLAAQLGGHSAVG